MPLAARAQQPVMPVIGFLRNTRAEGYADLTEALRAGLNEGGYDVGRNVAIEYRWTNEQRDRLSVLAAELISKPAAVIVANGVAAAAVKAATATVPIVFVAGSDPAEFGSFRANNSVHVTVSTIRRNSFMCGQTLIETE